MDISIFRVGLADRLDIGKCIWGWSSGHTRQTQVYSQVVQWTHRMDMSIVWVCPVDTPDKDIDTFKAGPVDTK